MHVTKVSVLRLKENVKEHRTLYPLHAIKNINHLTDLFGFQKCSKLAYFLKERKEIKEKFSETGKVF